MIRRLVLQALIVLLTGAHAPARAQAVSDRYRAVVALCEARKAAGILPDRQASLCLELIRAWEDRRSTRVRELLDETERELAKITEIRMAAAELVETRACSLEIYRGAHDRIEAAALDELALYQHLLTVDKRRDLLITIDVDASRAVRGIVPPCGWEEFEQASMRVRRVAGTAGLKPLILPGIVPERLDAREWILAATRLHPPPPVYLCISISGSREEWQRCRTALDRADTVYADFSRVSARSESPFSEIITMLADIPSRHTILIAPFSDSRQVILAEAITGLGTSVTALIFTQADLRGFTDGTRFIVSNSSLSAQRASLPLPYSSITQTLPMVTIHDNGTVLHREVTPWSRTLPLDLPPRSITFASLDPN